MPALIETITSTAHQEVASLYPELVPRYDSRFAGRNVTLFGSFRPENWERIKALRERFQNLGFAALAPVGDEFVPYQGDFPVLDADIKKLELIESRDNRGLEPDEAAYILEILFQMSMDTADFCYLVADQRDLDDGGYMGLLGTVELGRVLGRKPILASDVISPTLDERDGYYGAVFAGSVSGLYVASPEDVAEIMQAGGSFAVQGFNTVVQKGKA